jgi:hypothetical protein
MIAVVSLGACTTGGLLVDSRHHEVALDGACDDASIRCVGRVACDVVPAPTNKKSGLRNLALSRGGLTKPISPTFTRSPNSQSKVWRIDRDRPRSIKVRAPWESFKITSFDACRARHAAAPWLKISTPGCATA